jgi:MFS family permease
MMGTGKPFGLLHPTRRYSLILYADNIIDNIYRMTQGAFVLIGGRFGDVFGHKNILLSGGIWWIIWSLVSGFAKSIVTLSLFRGLTGIGAAFIVPNAVALLMHTFPPGEVKKHRNGVIWGHGTDRGCLRISILCYTSAVNAVEVDLLFLVSPET